MCGVSTSSGTRLRHSEPARCQSRPVPAGWKRPLWRAATTADSFRAAGPHRVSERSGPRLPFRPAPVVPQVRRAPPRGTRHRATEQRGRLLNRATALAAAVFGSRLKPDELATDAPGIHAIEHTLCRIISDRGTAPRRPRGSSVPHAPTPLTASARMSAGVLPMAEQPARRVRAAPFPDGGPRASSESVQSASESSRSGKVQRYKRPWPSCDGGLAGLGQAGDVAPAGQTFAALVARSAKMTGPASFVVRSCLSDGLDCVDGRDPQGLGARLFARLSRSRPLIGFRFGTCPRGGLPAALPWARFSVEPNRTAR